MSLTFAPEFKKRLRDSLLRCQSFKTHDERQVILNNLPFGNKIPYNAQSYVHALNIINTALEWPRGLEIMIDEVYAFEQETIPMQEVFKVLEEASTQAVRWGQVAKLKDILKAEKFDDDLIVQLCNENRPANAALATEDGGYELLRSCIEALAKWPYFPPDTAPLPAFLYRLLPNIQEEEVRDQCNRWMTAVTQELAMDLDAIKLKAQKNAANADGAASQGIPYLLVKVEQSIWNPATEVEIKGWLYYGGVYQSLNVEAGPYTHDKLPHLMAELIYESQRKLLAEAGKPLAHASKLVIEIFLPVDLLGSEIDQWSVKVGKWAQARPLGMHFLVVVRSFERVYDPEVRTFSWGLWRDKWNQRPMSPNLLTKANVYLACQASDYSETFYDKLAKLNLFFLGLTLIPPPDSDLEASEILGPMLDAGTPIALWLRHHEDDMTRVQKEIEELIYKNCLDSIPSLIYEKRSKLWDETESSVWKSVTLLWDDPDRLPPDVQAELKAP